MGGGGTWTVGLKHRDLFNGLIPIAGTSALLAPNLEAQMKSGGKKLPVLVVCGVKDALVAVAGCRAVADKAKTLDAPLTYREYPDGDHLSVVPMAVPDIYNWLDAEAGKK
jgi:predicted esterase